MLSLMSFAKAKYKYVFTSPEVQNVEYLKSITDEKLRPIFKQGGFFDAKTNEIVFESEEDIDVEKLKQFSKLEITSFKKIEL